MPKLVKEKQFLIKSLYKYETYKIGKTRSGKEYKGQCKETPQVTMKITIVNEYDYHTMKKELALKRKILTGNEIPKKFRMINKRNLNWEILQIILIYTIIGVMILKTKEQ